MASIYDLKPAFQNLLRPTTNALAQQGITANQVTVGAALLSLITGLCVYLFPTASWSLLLVPVTLLLRMALNAIDGMLAREHAMKSALGAFLNELGDVCSDAALYLPFAAIPGISVEPVILIVILAIITEMTGVIALQVGAERRYDGPMGKSDRALVFGVLGLLLGLGVRPGIWLDVLLLIVTVLLVRTIYNRTCRALREVTP